MFSGAAAHHVEGGETMNDRSASKMMASLAIPGLPSAQPGTAFVRACDVCGHCEFNVLGMRGDGSTILQCVHCGLGVLDKDRADDKRSGVAESSETPLWAEPLAALFAPTGAVTYLSSLPGSQGTTNDEVTAPLAGVVLVAAGLLEKAATLSLAMSRCVALLGQNGVLLFEVPVIVQTGSNSAWFNSRFDILNFPTHQTLRHLVEVRLGLNLTGMTIPSPMGGFTFVGAICKSDDMAAVARRTFAALEQDAEVLDDHHIQAWLALHMLHAGRPTREAVARLTRLLESAPSVQAMQRLADVWLATLERAEQWRRFNEEMLRRNTDRELEIARLHAELETVRQDARLNTAQAALAIVHEMERGGSVASKAARAQQALTEMERRYRDADQQLHAMKSSSIWQLTQPLRTLSARHPRVARRARQAAKLALWTAKFTVVKRVREVLRQRAVNHQALPSLPLHEVELLPIAGVLPDKQDAWKNDVWPVGRPLVSVIIPCFNYGHLVAEAIRSVVEQTLHDIEIIVVEGGSDSVESRRGFMSLAEHAPARVRVLLQEKPHRAGANRNFGISHARGKYICCLDADDRLAPTYLEKALFLLEHYSYDVVSPALQFFGDRDDTYAPPIEQPTLDALLEGNQVLTCAVFRRALWQQSGGFRDSDPATGHVHEDWLFWTRLAALGARFQNIREPLLFYRSHGQSLSTSAGVLDMPLQRHYIEKFNADVLPAPGNQMPRTQAVPGPSIAPLSNLVRLHEQFAHTPSLLLAVPYLVLGGAERLLSSVIAHLVKQGWHVTIVSSVAPDESQGDTSSWFASPGVSIYHLPRFLAQEKWKDFTDYLFATRRFDVLWLVGSAFFYEYLPVLRDRHPKLRVVDLLFNSVGHTANNRRYARYIDMNLVENLDVRNWLIAAGENPQRIETVASGVDLEKYAPGPRSAELQQYGIRPDDLIIGFSGRWSEEKDPLAIIEIASRIPAEIPVVFVMTGSGPMARQVIDRIAQSGLPAGRILVCGAVPDMATYLRSYDVLLLPSRIDGRPNVVMEALACGVPVVASRVGALPELVGDGVHGYLCEPGAYDQFASRIMELVRDQALLTRLKQAARTHAEQDFNVLNMQNAYARILDRLVAGDLSE
jgi:glycosyltransferase involved in cell wall biosynthesis/phage gp46-like protein